MYLIECSTINQILLCKYYLSSGTVILPARKSGESYQEFITKPPIKRKTLRLIPLIQCEIFMLVDQMPKLPLLRNKNLMLYEMFHPKV